MGYTFSRSNYWNNNFCWVPCFDPEPQCVRSYSGCLFSSKNSQRVCPNPGQHAAIFGTKEPHRMLRAILLGLVWSCRTKRQNRTLFDWRTGGPEWNSTGDGCGWFFKVNGSTPDPQTSNARGLLDRKRSVTCLKREDSRNFLIKAGEPLQGGAPPVISWFIIPITIDITPINPSYSTYKPT